jgi:hypothetical protein
MYFNNTVIKIRYDMIDKNGSHVLKEEDIFDRYDGIFHLEDGERIKQGTPLDSLKSHRMAYVTSDRENYSTASVKYVPYLHDREIYLNRIKLNTDYFYTSISHSFDYEVCKKGSGDLEVPNKNQVTSIIALNLSEKKMYSYS